MLRRCHNQLESLNFSFTECVPATETRIVVVGVFHPRYNYYGNVTPVIPKTTSQLNLRRDHQGHPTSIFCKVSFRESKYCLEFTVLTWGRLKIPR